MSRLNTRHLPHQPPIGPEIPIDMVAEVPLAGRSSPPIRTRRWGANCTLSGDLPSDVLGADELWLRVRLLTEHAEPRAGYTVAQFCRAVPAEGRTVFAIDADCVPPDERR